MERAPALSMSSSLIHWPGFTPPRWPRIRPALTQDWAHIDPTIFGTLIERFLDPDKRSQIGAHYTDAQKIQQIIEPVFVRPLQDEWSIARSDIQEFVRKANAKGNKSKDWQRAEERRSQFLVITHAVRSRWFGPDTEFRLGRC